MARLNLLLVLLACALGVVASQHKARTLFTELERAQEQARALDVEYGRLQLESGALGAPARVEQIASQRLGMLIPAPGRIMSLEVGGGAPAVAQPITRSKGMRP